MAVAKIITFILTLWLFNVYMFTSKKIWFKIGIISGLIMICLCVIGFRDENLKGEIIEPVIEVDVPKGRVEHRKLKSMTSKDVLDLYKLYDINNLGEPLSQISTDSLEFVYENGQLIEVKNDTPRGTTYKVTEKNSGLSFIEINTTYKNFEGGYDTEVIIHVGAEENSDILYDILDNLMEGTDNDLFIKNLINDTTEILEINFDNGSLVLTKGSGIGFGVREYDIYVKENLGVLKDGKLDASMIMEIEKDSNLFTFENFENSKDKEFTEILKKFDKSDNKDYDKITYEIAWVRDFDRDNNIELDEKKDYYMRRTYSKGNTDIVLHVDGYDRYNVNRKWYIGVFGTGLSDEMKETLLEKIGKQYEDKLHKIEYENNNVFKGWTLSSMESK